MWKIKLFSQLHSHAREQCDVCKYLKVFQFNISIQFKEKSNQSYSRALTLQSLLLGAGCCCCCCCCRPNEYIFGFNCSGESAQIPSLRFLRSLHPCWLHMGSSALLHQLSLHIQNTLLYVQQGCGPTEKINYRHLFEILGIKASDRCEWSL